MSSQAAITDSDIIDGLSVRYLKFFGLWKVINDYRITGKRNGIIKFELTTVLILMFPYVIFQLMSYFVMKVDIEKITILNLNSVPAMQVCCRIIVFWICIENISRLYNLLRKDFLDVSGKNVAEVKKIYKKISKKTNVYCATSLFVMAGMIALSIIYPGISVDYILHHKGSMAAVTTGRKKILGGFYPVPMGESPYYEVIFAYEAVGLIWGGICLPVYFCFFYQVLMCLYAQFSVLGLHISKLKVDHDGMLGRKMSNSEKNIDFAVHRELKKIVHDHQKLLRYSDELRSIYNPLVTMTLGTGILILIISCFQFLFSKSGDPVYIFRYLQILVYQGIEVCLFCFGSSSVEAASTELQFAIYSSEWYKADTEFRRTAQIVMVRARKGVTLTAIRMYPVNVETLMAILQFIYSVSTLMSRMTE